MKNDLSILIPSRNEEFLVRTIKDLLENIEGNTEIIVVLDGWFAEVPKHERVRVIHNQESIGQRAATNQACRLSEAKYVMKVDAHCSFDKGFDVKLIADMQDNWTVVPTMRNLWAFDWVCTDGHRRYQGPSGVCNQCGKETVKDIVWIAKTSPQSTAYCFDSTPHFQYHGEHKKKQVGDLVETMSLQGSCFMMTREKYWELNICDESIGSWGSQGIEVACKTWLSGGRVICNRKTWYAHLFRTQGGDFGFPYPQSGKGVEKAKSVVKELFFDNKWNKQILPLTWLVERFDPPEKYWSKEDRDKLKSWPLKSKGIIFFTDNQLNLKIARKVQGQLKSIGLPIVSCSLKPMSFGQNVVLNESRSIPTMFKQILTALETSVSDIVFLCEHDVLYHPSHFDFTPKDRNTFYYNVNVYKIKSEGGQALWVDDCRQVSGLCGYREELIKHYRERVSYIEKHGFSREMGFEPGTHKRIKWQNEYKSESWKSEFPNVDIRHNHNLTPNRWSKEQFRNEKYTEGWKLVDEIPYWGKIVL